ncbi:MAG: glycoside hydrolase family 32 protein [Phycisphaerae bacterium]|jgi:beta-fructofuranosidase|nr:glycoside hydrolase family 32 protein [Phycisphaerae bacterium]
MRVLQRSLIVVVVAGAFAGLRTLSAADKAPPKPGKNMIENARAFRNELLADPHRPGYHFVVPESLSAPLDPNGAIYWKGRYHLFYLYGRGGRIWAHVSSRDLFHWRQHPHALVPTERYEGGSCWSGDSFVAGDKAAILYWGKGGVTCLATSADDDLTTWKKYAKNPVIPGRPPKGARPEDRGVWEWSPGGKWYGDKAPCAWKEGDTWYCIRGGKLPGKGDTVFLFKSPDLVNWKYLHPFYEPKRKWTFPDDDNACPDFFKIGDKHMLLFISHRRGCQYYLGRYEKERFIPEIHGKMSWVDNEFFAPDSLLDDKGRRIMWAWIFDRRARPARGASGWSGTMSLPRVLTLGKDGKLLMNPPKEIEKLRYNPIARTKLTVKTDSELKLKGISGKSIELVLEIAPGKGAAQFGVKVCCSADGKEQTLVYYDAAEKKLKVDTTKSGPQGARKIEAGPLELKAGESLKFRVFVDKSVVEVFANNGRQAVTRRIYPSPDNAASVALFSKGGPATATSVKAWDIMPSNPY